MHIEDIISYKIRYNIDKKCRKEYYIHNRMYLYAILFHIHKWSLARIGKLFDTDHATVRHALREASHVQYRDEFIEDTKLLQEQFYFIIPEYKGRQQLGRKKKAVYNVTVPFTKERYINYLQTKDINEIYDIVWLLTLEKVKNNIRMNIHNNPKRNKS